MTEYTPKGHIRHWCSFCDCVVIDSTQPETGQFYVQFGHGYDEEFGEYTDEYLGVMFALCPACQPKERE